MFRRPLHGLVLMAVLGVVLIGRTEGREAIGERPPQEPGTVKLPAGVVATVNGRPITIDDVNRRLIERYGRAALQVLMVDAALESAAQDAGVTVSEEEIRNRLLEAEQREGGPAKLRRLLAAQGVDVRQFRRDLRRDLFAEKLLQKQGRLQVTDDDIENLYQREYGERVELAMMLLATEDEAKEVQRLLAEGADFGRLAHERSQDRATQPLYGRIGQVVRGDLIDELQETVFSLQPGQVSRTVLTQYGYHIFKVLERIPAQSVPLVEVKAKLRRTVRGNKITEQRQALIVELLRQAEIVVNQDDFPWVRPPEEVSAGARPDGPSLQEQ